jgi:Holliday junction resolvase-like predicted endonuclease
VTDPELPFALPKLPALLLAAAVFGAWIAWSAFKARLRFRLARSRARGQRGEVQAARWLERHGFTIVEEQATRTSMLMVDGQPCPFEVRADFVVRKGGRLAVIEVKTGAAAAITSSSTRRQLLEYAAIYRVDAVYLFDANTDSLYHTHFPHLPLAHSPRIPAAFHRWLQVAVLAIAVAGGWWMGRR